jgi:Na+-driven multidrug efflux pump
MKDLTVGKPMKVIWLFAVPMILGQIAQQLYSFTDSAYVVAHDG